jgi:hypothetical protein
MTNKELKGYEDLIKDHEWMLRASTITFWIAVAITLAMIADKSAWDAVFPLIGACIAAQYRVYWAALSGHGRGALRALDRGDG